MASSVWRENSQHAHAASVIHAFDDEFQRAACGVDGADDVLVGFQRVDQRSLGTIAQDVDANRKPAVENDVEPLRELGGVLAAET